MRARGLLAAALLLEAALVLASPEDDIKAALRDAEVWVDCTRSFDAACVAARSDDEYLRGLGTTPELFARTQSLLYARLKELHAVVTRFDLDRPREEFRLDGRDVVFIPYDEAIDAGGNHAESSAYLIGLSRDLGAHWQFVDGSTVTLADIRIVLPSYMGEPPLPEAYSSASNDGEAGPYRTLFTGFNGPKSPGTYTYFSSEEARASWLAQALGEERLDSVLSEVDFKRQILVAAAVGEHRTANGALSLQRIDVNDSRVMPYVRIGVNRAGCEEPSRASYPFVLAAIGRPKLNVSTGGTDQQDYPNGCARAASGGPHG
jgi:ribosomal protein L12E/L44/L45/RPP1/RPP2